MDIWSLFNIKHKRKKRSSIVNLEFRSCSLKHVKITFTKTTFALSFGKNVNDDDGVCFFTKVALISAQIKIDYYYYQTWKKLIKFEKIVTLWKKTCTFYNETEWFEFNFTVKLRLKILIGYIRLIWRFSPPISHFNVRHKILRTWRHLRMVRFVVLQIRPNLNALSMHLFNYRRRGRSRTSKPLRVSSSLSLWPGWIRNVRLVCHYFLLLSRIYPLRQEGGTFRHEGHIWPANTHWRMSMVVCDISLIVSSHNS